MTSSVLIERHGAVLEVTISRPPVNAIDDRLSEELYQAFCGLRDDSSLRVGIITGAGTKIFCAGWDLKSVAASSDAAKTGEASLSRPGGFAGLTKLWNLHKPVIGVINGACIGGGFELALALDLVVAEAHAEFWLPEMQRGFLADGGAVQRLPRRIPYNVAMELMLTGRRMPAEEAARWGLVNAVVPTGTGMAEARRYAATICDGAPLAVEALLATTPELMHLPEREAMERLMPGKSGVPSYERMFSSEDFVEGPRAFTEKRKPVWKGR